MDDSTLAAVDESFVPVRSPDAYTVTIDGEAVILDERENRLHLLNHSAALVWLCFDGHASIGELARELSEELGEPYEGLLDETVTIVGDLRREGLLAGGL
jgi:hypothetical protein